MNVFVLWEAFGRADLGGRARERYVDDTPCVIRTDTIQSLSGTNMAACVLLGGGGGEGVVVHARL